MFGPGKPFQSGLLFVGNLGAYPSEAPFRCTILEYALGLAHKLCWKGLQGTNSMAYYKNPYVTAARQ
jgi:hypothetical protein